MYSNTSKIFKDLYRLRSIEARMSYRSLTATLTLYRGGTLTLEEAARQSDVPPVELAAELRSRGIPVREEARADVTERTTT